MFHVEQKCKKKGVQPTVKRKCMYALFLLLCIAGAVLLLQNAITRRQQPFAAEEYSIQKLQPYLRPNAVLSFSDVYPDDWDALEVAFAGNTLASIPSLLEFDPSFQPFPDLYQTIVFSKDGNIVGYDWFRFQVSFVTAEEKWPIPYQKWTREEAVFLCQQNENLMKHMGGRAYRLIPHPAEPF